MKTTRQTLLLIISALVIMLTGCAAPADRSAMTPSDITVSKHFPYSINVRTSGGSATGAMDSSNISDADLQTAIEDAIRNSRLFTTIVKSSSGDYELSVSITQLSKPMFGLTFTVQMETAWSLTKVADRSVVFRKPIQSSGKATMSEAFVGVTRLRMAVEAAVRDSISQGLAAIAQLDL